MTESDNDIFGILKSVRTLNFCTIELCDKLLDIMDGICVVPIVVFFMSFFYNFCLTLAIRRPFMGRGVNWIGGKGGHPTEMVVVVRWVGGVII